jgi:NAD(P)H-dependent FMN reductase
MTKPKIGIIISTTREGRFGHRPAEWIRSIAAQRGDADYEIVDLRDYPMPFFEAPAQPYFMPVEHPEVRRWAAKIAELDGYIFVTAEYNHSIPAVLKNALDSIFHEPAKKPAAFVGYGGVGGARAIQELRLVSIVLGMAPTRTGVHIGVEPLLGMLQQGKDFADYPFLAPTVTAMLNELAWWTKVLKAGREAEAVEQSVAA